MSRHPKPTRMKPVLNDNKAKRKKKTAGLKTSREKLANEKHQRT